MLSQLAFCGIEGLLNGGEQRFTTLPANEQLTSRDGHIDPNGIRKPTSSMAVWKFNRNTAAHEPIVQLHELRNPITDGGLVRVGELNIPCGDFQWDVHSRHLSFAGSGIIENHRLE